ncbi:uncharacterized protein C16orf96 homolog [Clupea harengus]|uniref:Uncharacterized protein C16orf96 homolog n=1 Tax=Clupea harengus TaxID=7950 RepID=A0A6P8EXJ9_CLUHA|nr:uncharacterized protein C16orf96 homolog [Clupea harengus]
MSADISLFDLVNLSIGTPEPGAVQFNALHTLLHALIKHLNLQDVKTEWLEQAQDPSRDFKTPPPPDAQLVPVPREKPSLYHHMEGKLRHIEKQMSALDRLPSGTELLSRSASGTAGTGTPVSDMWQLMQVRRKVQANEDGVSKCMGLIQDLMKEIQELTESRDNLKTEVKTLNNQLTKLGESDLSDRVNALEKCCHLVEDLEKNMVALFKILI